MEHDKYKCLVVDDEPIARKIIINYIEQMPVLQLAAERINALDAIEYLHASADVDIIFLDINMPNLSGFQLLKIANPHQPVIFTTAYAEYAVESYELNAVDYLLKPFAFERFTKAVYKAIGVIRQGNKGNNPETVGMKHTIFIKSDGKNYPVLIDDILFCEAIKNYTMVILADGKKLMTLIPLSKFGAPLTEAGGNFIQIHRSFLIARDHITAVTANTVTIQKTDLPIGVQYKERFFKELGISK